MNRLQVWAADVPCQYATVADSKQPETISSKVVENGKSESAGCVVPSGKAGLLTMGTGGHTFGVPPQHEGHPDGQGRVGAEAFAVTPFHRLVRTHVFSAAGDALLAVALADSLFFNVDPNDARWKVATYLVLTLAPFAIVAPFLGPLMDRVSGGHRWVMVGAASVRALLMFGLVRYVQGPLLFPLAFSMLVMAKTHHIAKTALVPAMVESQDELVRSNSRLTILSGVAAATAGVPGAVLLRLGGAPSVLAVGCVLFVIAAGLGLRIPSVRVAAEPVGEVEREELRGAGVRAAANAMGYLRGVVGFVTLLLAFELRGGIEPGPSAPGVELGHRVREAMGLGALDLTTGGAPAWHFGVALVGVGLGGLAGSLTVPRLRQMIPERRILAFALFVLSGFGVLAALSGGVIGAFVAGFGVAIAGNAGKQSFDAIVQRDAPQANMGRTLGRFESRFQLFWVVGALLPVILPVPDQVGYLMVAISAAIVGAWFWLGKRPTIQEFRRSLARS